MSNNPTHEDIYDDDDYDEDDKTTIPKNAILFINVARGFHLRNIYDELVNESEYYFGHHPRSGTIAATDKSKLYDLTDDFYRSNKHVSQYIKDKKIECIRNVCYGVCVTPSTIRNLKIRSEVSHFDKTNPGRRKWVTMYEVRGLGDEIIKRASTKGAALRIAREYTEKTTFNTEVNIIKLLADRSDECVAVTSYKKSPKEQMGEWVLFGWVLPRYTVDENNIVIPVIEPEDEYDVIGWNYFLGKW